MVSVWTSQQPTVWVWSQQTRSTPSLPGNKVGNGCLTALCNLVTPKTGSPWTAGQRCWRWTHRPRAPAHCFCSSHSCHSPALCERLQAAHLALCSHI